MADKLAKSGRMLTRRKYTEVYPDHPMECMPLNHRGRLDPDINKIRSGAMISIGFYIASTIYLSSPLSLPLH
jgi:hypothetical protein